MKTTKIRIGKTKIRAEIANSFFSKMKGLMFRRSLGKKEGMLFPFRWMDYHTIWMFGMNFPIDIIWADKNKRIVHIVENARPYIMSGVYMPAKKAKYVIEVSAGFVKKHKIKLGMRVDFRI